MNDQPPESRPAAPGPDHQPTQALPAQQAPAPEPAPDVGPAPEKQRLRDRVWSFRALIAVALASVIMGGLGGAALANVAQDDDERRLGPGQGWFDREGPGGPPGLMKERKRERIEKWRRGMGQRQWGQEGPPGIRPSDLPTPPAPTPTTG